MRLFAGMFTRELLRSPSRVLVMILPVVMTLLFNADRAWQAGWPDVSADLSLKTAIMSPFVGATAAYVTAQRAQPDLRRFAGTGARSLFVLHAVPLAACLAHAVAGLLFGSVYPLVTVALSDAPGGPWLGYLPIGLGYMVFAAGVGLAAATLVPRGFITPGVVFLALMLLPVAIEPPITGTPDLVPASTGYVWLAVAAALLAISLGAANKSRDGAGLRRIVAVAPVAGIGLALALGPVGYLTPLQVEREPVSPICDPADTVCVWPEHSHHLPELAGSAQRLRVYSDLGLRPATPLYEFGLDASGQGVFTYPPAWFAQYAFASSSLRDIGLCPEGMSLTDDAILRRQELLLWATRVSAGGPQPASVKGGPVEVDPAAIDAIHAQPQAEQREWAAQRVAAVRAGCEVAAGDV